MRPAFPAARWLLLGLLGAAAPGYGQNVVVNGDFDANVAGWSFDGRGTVAWDPLDSAGSPTSGSGRITSAQPPANAGAGASQCIPFALTGPFELGARIRFPSGQDRSGFTVVGVALFENATCTGRSSAGANVGTVRSSTTDTWVTKFATNFAPVPATQSILMRLYVYKAEPGGTLTVQFDHAVFGPAGTTPVELLGFAVE
jgi:hypothetical protein